MEREGERERRQHTTHCLEIAMSTQKRSSSGASSSKRAKVQSGASALPMPDEPKKGVMFYAMVHGQRIRVGGCNCFAATHVCVSVSVFPTSA